MVPFQFGLFLDLVVLYFISICPNLMPYCSTDFPMCSFWITFFLSLRNAFVLLLIMSVDLVGSNTGTLHAKVTSGSQETFQSVTKNITQNFIVFSPAVVLVSILSFFAHLLNISFKNLPPLLLKSCLGNAKYAIHFLYICLIISSSVFV